MMSDEVVELLRRDPFQPFRIKLINGDGHDIANPAIVAVLEKGLYIASLDGHWAQFRYNQITSLESLVQYEP